MSHLKNALTRHHFRKLGETIELRLLCCCMTLCSLITSTAHSKEVQPPPFPEENHPNYSLPILNEKRIVAHYMTNMLFHKKGRYQPTYFDREHYFPNGPSRAIGGATQTYPLMDFRTEKTMDQAAEFELTAAVKTGLDGFQFFYPTGVNYQSYNAVIAAFFRAAEKLKLDFKFTICLCSAREGTSSEAAKIDHWRKALQDLTRQTKGLNHWLKTPDGRTIIYIWNGVGFSDKINGIGHILQNPGLIKYDARTYYDLALKSNIEVAYVFHVTQTMATRKKITAELFKYYPAFWYWLPTNSLDGQSHDSFAAKCAIANRTYMATVYPDFYTSKPYRKDNKMRLWKLEEMLNVDVEGMYRRVIVTGLSREFRRNFEHGIKHDVPLINVVTWNDYPEGHQICPDINHNFSFSVLLNHYKNIWRNTEEANKEEIGIVFFKKYASTAKPSIADFALENLRGVPLEDDDFIEAVTILKQPARIFINGIDCGIAPAGLAEKRIPIQAGQVTLKIIREEKTVISVTAPEWITNHPYRTDRFTYGYSSQYDSYWNAIFGNMTPITAQEYNEKTGLPNWKQTYHRALNQ